MRRTVTRLLMLVAMSACNARVFSPPTGTFLTESSATVGKGRHSAGGDVFMGGALFGPHLLAYRGTYRYGLRPDVDLSASPSLLAVRGAKSGDSHPNAYALRLGIKYAPIKHLALLAGAGGGGSAAGGFVSPDLGAIVAYENPYVIPFGSARALLSAPVSARTVHFTVEDDADDGPDDADSAPDAYRLKPRLTLGVQLALGVRVPLTYDGDSRVRPALACSVGLTSLRDRSERGSVDYSGFDCAVEVRF